MPTRPMLVALTLAACTGASAPDPEPCAVGMAVTADGEAHATLPAAVERALQLDGVVDVCPGKHEVAGNLGSTRHSANRATLTIRGAGMEATSLRAVGEGAWASERETAISVADLSLESARTEWTSDDCTTNGESDVECDSPFDRDGYPEGALFLYGDWVFERVRVADNEGYWGGAITARQTMDDWNASLTFIDSEILRNSAVDDTRGGAVLVDYNDDWGPRGELTITSINTDWGEGGDDNAPDDIAFASWDGYFHDSLVVHASYRFEGVADFTCDALAYTCE